MAEDNNDVLVASKADAAQGVTPGAGNDDATGDGNPAPAAPSNEPPKEPAKEQTPEEKAKEAEAKAAEAKAATDKAAEEAAAEAAAKAAKEDTPLDTKVWGTTGNETADSVLTMLQNADVSPEDAKALLFDAVQAGDLTKIDRAALEAKVGKTKATLIMAGVTTFVADKAKKNAAIIADIQSVSGGEENWAKMAAWGKANLTDAELVEYRGMIDSGGAQARFAASEIAAKYNADPANSTIDTAGGTSYIEGDAGKGVTARATTRAEYVAELNKAHRSGASEAALNEITAARHRGRAKGI